MKKLVPTTVKVSLLEIFYFFLAVVLFFVLVIKPYSNRYVERLSKGL